MMSCDFDKEKVRAEIDALQDEYVKFWLELVKRESPTGDKAAVDFAGELIKEKALELGFLVKEQKEEAIETSVLQETLQVTASYFLETVCLQSQTEEREQLALPGFMVGIDLKGLTAYVKGYMEAMPVNEYLAGLVSYEIVSFSQDKVVLRKTYNETKVENKFFICRRGEFIVVYYSDLKTVYEYTDIRVDGLIEEIQTAINQGFYVKDVQELYSILEGYTS